ncbi:MAG TPA: hypothetical protein VG271_00225 [Beijerinckiaceae bacterium]|nr:hypothetical protein [Beijerinckiaceae bacterium]
MLDSISDLTRAAQFTRTREARRPSFARRKAVGEMSAIVGMLVLCLSFSLPSKVFADPSPQAMASRVATALENITLLQRPGQMGFATVWDGNKYVQCGRKPDGSLRCEAAGTLMQPSLEHVLVPEKLARLGALGWRLDPSFGNYVQIFAGGMPASAVADAIVQVLAEAYGAQVTVLDVETYWVASEPCPPRNGRSQNLAGLINDVPSMASTAVHACSYARAPGLEPNPPAAAAETLIAKYGRKVTEKSSACG